MKRTTSDMLRREEDVADEESQKLSSTDAWGAANREEMNVVNKDIGL